MQASSRVVVLRRDGRGRGVGGRGARLAARGRALLHHVVQRPPLLRGHAAHAQAHQGERGTHTYGWHGYRQIWKVFCCCWTERREKCAGMRFIWVFLRKKISCIHKLKAYQLILKQDRCNCERKTMLYAILAFTTATISLQINLRVLKFLLFF